MIPTVMVPATNWKELNRLSEHGNMGIRGCNYFIGKIPSQERALHLLLNIRTQILAELMTTLTHDGILLFQDNHAQPNYIQCK